MRALRLEYLANGERTSPLGYLLAIAAAAFVFDTAAQYRDLRTQIATKEARLATALARSKGTESNAPARTFAAEEHAFARETVQRLSTPWSAVFRSLESAHSDRVALLSIEPDAGRRTVTVTGEAKDYLATLTYLADLARQQGMKRVHLVRHEMRREGGRHAAVAFTISAAWSDER